MHAGSAVVGVAHLASGAFSTSSSRSGICRAMCPLRRFRGVSRVAIGLSTAVWFCLGGSARRGFSSPARLLAPQVPATPEGVRVLHGLFKPAAPSGREIRRRPFLHHGPRQPDLYVLLGTVKLTKEAGDFSRQTTNYVSFLLVFVPYVHWRDGQLLILDSLFKARFVSRETYP